MLTSACLAWWFWHARHAGIFCGPLENEGSFHLELSQILRYEDKQCNLLQPSWKKSSRSNNPSQINITKSEFMKWRLNKNSQCSYLKWSKFLSRCQHLFCLQKRKHLKEWSHSFLSLVYLSRCQVDRCAFIKAHSPKHQANLVAWERKTNRFTNIFFLSINRFTNIQVHMQIDVHEKITFTPIMK